MSRIPAPEHLRLADQIQAGNAFADKVKALEAKMSPRAATLCALHYEAISTIARLAELVDRGSNPVLIDKAITAVQRWNDLVREARVLVKAG